MMEAISPNIFVNDVPKTIDFYKLLGFKVAMSFPENETPAWAMMNCGKVNFMFQSFKSLGDDLPEIKRENGGSLLLYMDIKEIRKFYASIKKEVTVLKGLEKTFYGTTEFSILDLNGYVLTFAEDEK